MNKVIELENALTELFRKGTEVGYSETEIDEFLEDIDYDILLQAVWNNAETVYSYRADGEHEFSMDYRGTELFKQRATLLYEDMGDSAIQFPLFRPAPCASGALLSAQLSRPRRKFQSRGNLQLSPYNITHLHCIVHSISMECCYMQVD